MSMRYETDDVTGVANTLTLGAGITSTEQETLRVNGVYLSVDEIIGNTVEGWISQTRHMQVDDRILDTDEADGSPSYRSTTKVNYLAVGRDLRPGETFQVGIRCGGTATDVVVVYDYEVTNE